MRRTRASWGLYQGHEDRGGKDNWRDTSRRVREEANFRCYYCKQVFPMRELQTHHEIRVSKVPINEAENLRCVCKACHKREHDLERSRRRNK